MIRFNLLKLIDKIEAKEGRRYPLREISEKSGCDKNALSRLVNQPQIIPSANVIDRLVQFFFFELTRDSSKPHLDKNRMRSVVKDFVCVFPDDKQFWGVIPDGLKNNPKTSLADIWDVYTQVHTPRRTVDETEVAIRNSLKSKLLDAEQNKQEGFEVELSLTHEEFEMLREKLPKSYGGKAKE